MEKVTLNNKEQKRLIVLNEVLAGRLTGQEASEVLAHVQQLDGRTLVLQLSSDLDKRHRLVLAQSLEWHDRNHRHFNPPQHGRLLHHLLITSPCRKTK
jgi:hypothetical protein